MAKAIRDVYGETLAQLSHEYKDLVVLDADVSGSTKSALFKAEAPERFFNMGIAESNMLATAAGLSAAGKIPVANTFAVFLGTAGLLAARGQICYGNLNVKLAGAYCGLSDSYDGATHHGCEDISAMRTLPNMKILVPSDEISTRALTKLMIDTKGPVYLRVSRDVYPEVYQQKRVPEFKVGKGNVVRPGKDVTVIACGLMVSEAMAAAGRLAQENIQVRVVDMYSVKPVDRELIIQCAKETGAFVCAEEHSVIGGLGSAVAEMVAGENLSLPVGFVGVKDVFTESGDYHELLKKYELDDEAIEKKIREVIAKKK